MYKDGENMQVEQKNLWDNVTRSLSDDATARGIAAYQANVAEYHKSTVVQQEHFEKTVGVSANGTIDMATYEKPGANRTVAQEVDQHKDMKADDRKNEIAVLANTTSAADYKAMEENGFSINETDSHTIITVTDKIKAVLAKAGVDISIYGDRLTEEQLQDITGDPAVAQQIMRTLEGNDLPTTAANIQDSMDALSQAVSLDGISDKMLSYLLKNDLQPSISNLYMAQYSGAANSETGVGTSEISDGDFADMEGQISAIIESAGLEVNEETLANSKWLIENQIPLTGDHLQSLSDLLELSQKIENGEIDWNQLLDHMAKAIGEGKRPGDVNMITSQRRMEENRLIMTTEAESTMGKLGVEADIKSMEDTVESLKDQEKQYYRNLMDSMGIPSTDENVEKAVDTISVFDALKGQPAYVIGQIDAGTTIEEIYDNGSQMQQALEKANERYETLMTAPRRDMGDSIQKAFSNAAESLLKDMNLENSAANQRAVRILGYNGIDIYEENIQIVKALDEQMQRAFKNMTPAVTLEMIRRRENPLDMSMEQLNQVAEDIKQETGNEDQERFSRYLWKLEQNYEITEEERSGYIGIYRLIAQVEKTDGAALGALMQQGSDITMRNLLTAVRSSKKSGMNYEINDNFDGVQAKETGIKIDQQIEVAFQTNCVRDILDEISPEKLHLLGENQWQNMTPEQLAEALSQIEETPEVQQDAQRYAQEQLEEVQQALNASQEVYEYLDRYDISNSVANIMAVNNMLRHPNQMMDKLWKEYNFSTDSVEKIEDLKQQVLDAFGESIKTPEELAEAQETLAEVAEHVMETMIIEDPDVNTIDVRAMKQATMQFQLCAKKSKEESFMIPVQTGDGVTAVSLKVVRGKKEKGWVDILFDTNKLGKVAASFQAKEDGVSGMIAVDEEDTQMFLSEHLDTLTEALREGTDAETENIDIKIAYVSDLSLEHYEISQITREARLKKEGGLATNANNPVQTRRLYHIAEGFIQSMQKLQS